MTWDAVDFNRKCVHINKQLIRDRDSGEYHFGPTKNGKERTLFLPDELMELLEKQKETEALKRLAAGAKWENKNLVFSNPTGGYLSRQTVYTCFKRIVKRLGIPDVTIHTPRHTYCSMAFDNGDDPKTVQSNLGHATPEFTQRVYANSTEGMRKNSAERMGKKMNEICE